MDVIHCITLKYPNKIIQCRHYNTPCKYHEAWDALLDQHIEAGCLQPVSSPFVSPTFLIPKKDPTTLPRWVNDYRTQNVNTIPDNHLLLHIDEILQDCVKGKIFGKFDMTNSVFQTRIHPDDIKYTAIDTPRGLHKWTIMPQGGRNAPVTHQHRMFIALWGLIGKICHAYLNDIIIWSQTVAEHAQNVTLVLDALWKASLFCSPKKMSLFCTEINFLGHHISSSGIKADTSKAKWIIDWPVPQSTNDVWSFLGLIWYLDQFLPHLTDHTCILAPLTTKSSEPEWPGWTNIHQESFNAIKCLVVSWDCLMTIDHNDLKDNKVFVTCNVSDWCTGAMLSVGPTPQNAWPVVFNSMQLQSAQLNYPVHEKELLAIVCTLKKWCIKLLGTPFTIYTDHQTLENFMMQWELSQCQARWQEFFGQYDFNIEYIPGEDNTITDALSQLPPENDSVPSYAWQTQHMPMAIGKDIKPISLILSVMPDASLLNNIKKGYLSDPWCIKLMKLTDSLPGLQYCDKLLYLNNCLIILHITHLCETIFQLAHDQLGHFGINKSYAVLGESFYWPNMRQDLEDSYISACMECARNKSCTTKPARPLHPFPVPDCWGESIAIVGPLPTEHGYDAIMTITNCLGTDIRLVPCQINMNACEITNLFFNHWYCKNSLPLNIISDHDKLFTSKFWKALHHLTGVKLKMSTAYHLQTDGASECTNKTVYQALRFFIDRHQTGWVNALPHVWFNIMSTINTSMGYTPFHLHLGWTPHLIPPLTTIHISSARNNFPTDIANVLEAIVSLKTDVANAHDTLLASKVTQAHAANTHCSSELCLQIGNLVYLSTAHQWWEYLTSNNKRVAKSMPQFDGLYTIVSANPESSTYTLDLPCLRA